MARFAYSFNQSVPAELVSSNNQSIVDLIARDHDVMVGADVLDDWTTTELNDRTTFKVLDTQAGRTPGDVPSGSITTYEAFEGGFAYQIEQQFSVPPAPTLSELKTQGAVDAAAKSLLFLDGGFFHDDGAGGGSVLYDSEEVDRANYSVTGVQGNIIGAPFTFIIRDSAFVQHNWNSAQWEDFFNSFFNHVILARDDLEAALLAIDAAVDEVGIQAAIDNIPPPNNTI